MINTLVNLYETENISKKILNWLFPTDVVNKLWLLYLMFYRMKQVWSYHVVWSFARMSEWKIFWNNSVEHHLHVVPHVRVPVLVDGEGGAGVEELNMHQTNRKLWQLRQLRMQTLNFWYKMQKIIFFFEFKKKNIVKVVMWEFCFLTPLSISSVTRWTPRCCGRRWTFLWSQALGPTMRPEGPCWDPWPDPLLWLAEHAMF